jgi:hypothetical protein
VRGCLFFALSQRIGEEKTLKGLMPLRNPQNFALSLSFGGYQKEILHLQFLRNKIQRFCFYCKQTISPYFIPRRASKQKTRKTSVFEMQHLSSLITRGGENQSNNICLKVSPSLFNSGSQALKAFVFAKK